MFVVVRVLSNTVKFIISFNISVACVFLFSDGASLASQPVTDLTMNNMTPQVTLSPSAELGKLKKNGENSILISANVAILRGS